MITLSSLVGNTIPFWGNVWFWLFIVTLIAGIVVVGFCLQKIREKTTQHNVIQQQHVAKMDKMREDHSIIMDGIRSEMLKKEEERIRQWMESEKETLHVLNGVSQVLELSENIGRVESEKILTKLTEIKGIVEKKNGNHEKNGETERS